MEGLRVRLTLILGNILLEMNEGAADVQACSSGTQANRTPERSTSSVSVGYLNPRDVLCAKPSRRIDQHAGARKHGPVHQEAARGPCPVVDLGTLRHSMAVTRSVD